MCWEIQQRIRMPLRTLLLFTRYFVFLLSSRVQYYFSSSISNRTGYLDGDLFSFFFIVLCFSPFAPLGVVIVSNNISTVFSFRDEQGRRTRVSPFIETFRQSVTPPSSDQNLSSKPSSTIFVGQTFASNSADTSRKYFYRL